MMTDKELQESYSRRWTPERKEHHRKLIQKWKPWEKSTGAKTAEGKQISKMNAMKYGGNSTKVKAFDKEIKQALKLANKIYYETLNQAKKELPDE